MPAGAMHCANPRTSTSAVLLLLRQGNQPQRGPIICLRTPRARVGATETMQHTTGTHCPGQGEDSREGRVHCPPRAPAGSGQGGLVGCESAVAWCAGSARAAEVLSGWSSGRIAGGREGPEIFFKRRQGIPGSRDRCEPKSGSEEAQGSFGQCQGSRSPGEGLGQWRRYE